MMKIAMTAALEASSRAPILFRGKLEEAFATAARLGYDSLEIHLLNPRDIDQDSVNDLRVRHGLFIPTLGTGMAAGKEGLTFTDSDSAVRARAVERIFRHIDLAVILHSGVTIGLIYGSLGSDPAWHRQKKEAALGCLKECCRYAEKKGVILYLEAINRYEMDSLCTLEQVLEDLRQVGSGNLKVLADTFHMNIEEVDLLASLRRAGEQLGHVHLSDSNRQAPGHGHLNVAAVLNTLREIRFQGCLSFEILPLPDPESAARDAITQVKGLLATR
jgi:sugar phosphate isomerase/epimerase